MNDNRSNQQILFLTDEQLRLGIEAMFFAFKGFTADPDKILDGDIDDFIESSQFDSSDFHSEALASTRYKKKSYVGK